MASALAAIVAEFCAESLHAAINATWTDAGLPTLSAPVQVGRWSLRERGRLPALAVELGEIESRSEGSGLRSMRGTATWWLSLAAASEPTLLTQLRGMLDGLRQATEVELADRFQHLSFAGTNPAGQRETVGGLPRRTATARFRFVWLYEPGVL